MKKREAWKYVKINELLKFLKKSFEFEYRINDNIYDLALFNEKLLVEFDGKYHTGTYQKNIDRYKEKIANGSGWKLVRIKTKENAIIPPESLYAILKTRK